MTANGDNGRTGANLQETQLSPATVSPGTFGKIGVFPVDGQVYAQILVATGVSIPGRGVRNVIYAATMHNTVYAFDADATPPAGRLWQISLGASVPTTQIFGAYSDISNEVGVLGTGAIDLQRGVLYVVSETLVGTRPTFFLHALDLGNGEERMNGPVQITGSVTGSGAGSGPDGTVVFDPQQHLQRPGLLVQNNSVYVAFGSHADEVPWHGWLMSYDADSLRQTGVFNTTPDGGGGALWQSGRGVAADPQSNVYLAAGNGDYDGVRNFGESFLKLAGIGASPAAFYTPPDWKSLSDNDFDLSAGPALISGQNIMAGADKLGNLYLLNGDTMKALGTGPASFAGAQSSIFSLAVWSRPDTSLVYVQGTREPLKAYRVTATGFDPTPAAASSININFGRIGMTLSANGVQSDSGIIWQTSGDYNDASAPGTLRAFNASDLTELWNSDMNPARDLMPPVAKFASPTVANGRVFVPTFGNSVAVYGALEGVSDPSPAVSYLGNAATYDPQVSPGEMIAIFGAGLGPAEGAGMQVDQSGLVPTTLAGTRVLFDGVPGVIVFAGVGQVNAIVPFGAQPGPMQIQVEVNGRTSDTMEVTVQDASPGIFTADSSGRGQALAVNPDGTVNTPDNPAPSGSIVLLYATGVGQLKPSGEDGAVARELKTPALPVSAKLGDQPVNLGYAGSAPGMVEGVVQVNLEIPANTPADPAVPVALTVGGHSSAPGITISVGNR